MKLDLLPAKLSFKKCSFLKTSCPQVIRLNSQEDILNMDSLNVAIGQKKQEPNRMGYI